MYDTMPSSHLYTVQLACEVEDDKPCQFKPQEESARQTAAVA